MNIFGKVLVVVVFLLSVGFAVSQMILFQQRRHWREEYNREEARRQSVEGDLAGKSRDLERLKDEFDNFRRAKAVEIANLEETKGRLEQDIVRLNSRIETANRQISEAQALAASRDELLTQRDRLITQHEERIKELDENLKARMDEIAAFEEQVRAHTNTIGELEKEIAGLNEEKRKALTRLEDRERQLAELEARGVRVDIGKAQPAIDGLVSRVDNEIGVVVINRGESHGVEINFDFVI